MWTIVEATGFGAGRKREEFLVNHLLFGSLGGSVMMAGVAIIVCNRQLVARLLPVMRRIPFFCANGSMIGRSANMMRQDGCRYSRSLVQAGC